MWDLVDTFLLVFPRPDSLWSHSNEFLLFHGLWLVEQFLHIYRQSADRIGLKFGRATYCGPLPVCWTFGHSLLNSCFFLAFGWAVFSPWPFRPKGYCCLHLSVRPSVNFTCPHDNSSQIWSRITKFAPNMHLGILWAGIENGGHWPWPSRSFGHFDLKFLEIRLVRAITRHRFGLELPNLHWTCILEILSVGIEIGGHGPWPSRSFWPFWLRILGNSACPCDNS